MGAKLAGGGGGGRFNIEQNSDINVTPFVDVMLVLLIIFMVAAPMAAVSVEVTLPTAVAKAAQNPPKPIYISIQSNGNYYLGDQRFDTAYELADTLSREVGRRDPSKERIFIRGDKFSRYGTFMEVMNSLQDRGFYSVALVGADNAT